MGATESTLGSTAEEGAPGEQKEGEDSTPTVSSAFTDSSFPSRPPLSSSALAAETGYSELRAAPKLAQTRVGSHCATLKGEDGLRAERLTIGADTIAAALIADGHGGHVAAACVIEGLLSMLAEHAQGDASAEGLRAAATSSFHAMHQRVVSAEMDTTAGTTVTLCLVNETRGEITCCSVGDSAAILIEPPPPDSSVRARRSTMRPVVPRRTRASQHVRTCRPTPASAA